jgi:serine protease Do
MGYAIPISDIQEDVKTMMNSEVLEKSSAENRGYLGVTIISVDASTSEAYGIPQGAYVSSVVSGYAADKAGIIEGDVITAIDGKAIKESKQLTGYLDYYKAGDTVTVTVTQKADGYQKEDKVEVTLTKAPDDAEIQGQNGGRQEREPEEREEEEPGQDQDRNEYEFMDPFGDDGMGGSDFDEWLRRFGF